MFQVSGPTVFPGYLAYDGPSPFVEDGGKRWYVTGDLGEMDADSYLWIGGRLKRFLKAGGEMISLPALEEPFARLYPPTEEGPRVAVEGVEEERGRWIVLFTTEPLSLRDVAGAVGLTPGHVTTVVRRRTGRTVQQWITERRLREARRLLHDTDLTVGAVAARVGFRDAGYFVRRFRAEHGVPPGRWRAA